MNEDRIHIRGLRLRTRIGVPGHERASVQELKAHLEIEPERPLAGLGDQVSATIDYHQVIIQVEVLAGEGERRLLETLAEEIAELVLGIEGAAGVRVQLEKFILPQTESVGVSISRRKG